MVHSTRILLDRRKTRQRFLGTPEMRTVRTGILFPGVDEGATISS